MIIKNPGCTKIWQMKELLTVIALLDNEKWVVTEACKSKMDQNKGGGFSKGLLFVIDPAEGNKLVS